MRGKKLNVVLVPSTKMEVAKEHLLIRVPKKVRNQADFSRQSVTVLGKRLKVHQAFATDIAKVKKDKKIENIPIIGFVSRTLFDKINKGDQKEISGWVSEATEPLKIGCDPEFVLINKDTGEYTYAGNSNDDDTPSAYLSYDRDFGSDGPCVELRPKEAIRVKTLVSRIRKLLEDNNDNANKYLWQGGSVYECDKRICSIGGHISLGRIEQVKKETTQVVYKNICCILNNIVGLPLYTIEAPSPWRRRKTSHDGPFGKYSDFRIHGDYRMEWRVPGGFWLVHPELATTVLSTAKAATEAIYSLYAQEGYDPKFLCSDEHYPSHVVKVPIGIYEIMPDLDEPTDFAKIVMNSETQIDIPLETVNKCLKTLDMLCIAGETKEKYKRHLGKFGRMVRKGIDVSLFLHENWLNDGKLTIN